MKTIKETNVPIVGPQTKPKIGKTLKWTLWPIGTWPKNMI